MKYKGYVAIIKFNESQNVFHGSVVNSPDEINFKGKSVDELHEEFKSSVDEYLNYCKKTNKNPEKPYSGIFTVRIDPILHQDISIYAKENKISINKAVVLALKKEYQRR